MTTPEELADRTERRRLEQLERRQRLHTQDRITAVLNELRTVLQDGVHRAAKDERRAEEAARSYTPGASQLWERTRGRREGWEAALQALRDAQADLAYGIEPGNTRAENAANFAEAAMLHPTTVTIELPPEYAHLVQQGRVTGFSVGGQAILNDQQRTQQ